MTKLLALALLVPLLLAGCKPGGAITCPKLKVYSQTFLDKAERELGEIERTAPTVTQMVNDYGVTREAIRKCLSLQRKMRS